MKYEVVFKEIRTASSIIDAKSFDDARKIALGFIGYHDFSNDRAVVCLSHITDENNVTVKDERGEVAA